MRKWLGIISILLLLSTTSLAQEDLSWLLDLLPTSEGDISISKLLRAGSRLVLPQDVLLNETFDTASAWEDYTSPQGATQVVEGVYVIESSREDIVMWGQNDTVYENLALQVQVEQVSASSDNAYGLMCRANPSRNLDAYYFFISGDAHYSVFLIENGAFRSLKNWTRHTSIQTGQGARNQLLAICQDDYLAFYINNALVAEIVDDTFSSGTAGMAAMSYQADESITIHFDNLQIWSTEGQ